MELRKMIHGGQMKRSLKERVLDYFIYMGRKSRLLKIPAIIGLAVSIWFFRVVEYFKGGTKRFTCVMFILLCFMAGNSFAYPVFQKDSGFVDGEKEQVEAVSEDDSISFADQDEGKDPLRKKSRKKSWTVMVPPQNISIPCQRSWMKTSCLKCRSVTKIQTVLQKR